MSASAAEIIGAVVFIVLLCAVAAVYKLRREKAFPAVSARKQAAAVADFSAQAQALAQFLTAHRNQKVFINVVFAPEVKLALPAEADDRSFEIMLWCEACPNETQGRATGLNITVEDDRYKTRGPANGETGFALKGEFTVSAFHGDAEPITHIILIPVQQGYW
ncbi:hypothetical protein BN137_2850 [Cronobacter condimenti 1330]|uniref:Uncharacterized protein n=1 Tax=Cronobacter condimenti 1330 TaxID=1073999 RepID=K8A1N8_9ENTR|nr:hypothetical protein [Cronobacter condimenti]ALB62524.1 hypothetical protein AFK62_08415 [Cronobacter condimenti 1330]CCJ73473.1 hypothetical protein BN137_2850 [Cronobacter condimenti 1330]